MNNGKQSNTTKGSYSLNIGQDFTKIKTQSTILHSYRELHCHSLWHNGLICKLTNLRLTQYLTRSIITSSWRCHLQHVEAKCPDRINPIRSHWSSTAQSNKNIMHNTYKAIVKTILTYGFTTRLRPEMAAIVENHATKAIRAALNLPQYSSVYDSMKLKLDQ